jgi:hypothetical protein
MRTRKIQIYRQCLREKQETKRMAMPGNEKCACCVIPAARFQAGLKCSGSSKRKEEVSGVAFLSTHGV